MDGVLQMGSQAGPASDGLISGQAYFAALAWAFCGNRNRLGGDLCGSGWQKGALASPSIGAVFQPLLSGKPHEYWGIGDGDFAPS
jgi:hypothetical protein